MILALDLVDESRTERKVDRAKNIEATLPIMLSIILWMRIIRLFITKR